MWKRLLAAIAVCIVVAIAGCSGSGTLLSNVSLTPTTISPNADGVDDVARIPYTVHRECRVSIVFTAADGTAYDFRQDQLRSPGSYEALFGGNVQGRVLPNGQYTWTVEAATPDGREQQRVEGQVTITGADTTLPELRDFTVFPPVFTPNQDGIDDRVTISYFLTKAASVRVWLADQQGNFVAPLEEREGSAAPGQPGRHEIDYDAGVDADAPPPPDGEYKVIAEATDAVGNVVHQELPLTIKDGGVPRAQILFAEFKPTIVPLSGTLEVQMTVENVGTVPLRTTGPASGTKYTTRQNFNSLGWPEESGAFRVGVWYDTDMGDLEYPFRWAIGRPEDLSKCQASDREYLCLMPGKRAEVIGYVQIVDRPLRRQPKFFVGLLQEDVRKHNDRNFVTQISVQY
jgi:hypothetical protein